MKDLTSTKMPLANDFENGPKINPLKIIQTYDASEWEMFIDEWVHSLKYMSVQRMTGPGDMGVDIAGFCDKKKFLGTWHNYQCKHYTAPLSFSVVAPEIGKILRHSFSKAYIAPKTCQFIAPKGASTQLSLLLGNADKLKQKIIENWNKAISKKITSTCVITLDKEFLNYIKNFNFKIFSAVEPRLIICDHSQTRYYISRFGGGLPPRTLPDTVPDEINVVETTYTKKLFDAYEEHKGEIVTEISHLDKWDTLKSHFQRSREAFYHAESLRVFVREKVESGIFETLQTEILEGVLDTYDGAHSDGYRRVAAVTDTAQSLALDAHPLNKSTTVKDRRGICHQLANDGKLTWKR